MGSLGFAPMPGRVEGIFITPERGAMPEPVDSVRALAGRGLEGNRYFFEADAPPGRALTLIAAEAVEAMEQEHGISLEARATRRNVVTRGVDVNDLVGKRFRVGEVECLAVRLCEPCKHLESMTRPGLVKDLLHRAGINANILSDGTISVGDDVRVVEDARPAVADPV
jgi:MOSC domain-containing protein YiiM